VMPFMILWKPGDPEDTGWTLTGEKLHPEDGAVVRRWSRARYDSLARLEHTQDRYRVIREGTLLAEEEHQRSPATRWYSLDEARDLFRQAGFGEPAAYQAFSQSPAQSGDTIFTLVGSRSMRTNAGDGSAGQGVDRLAPTVVTGGRSARLRSVSRDARVNARVHLIEVSGGPA